MITLSNFENYALPQIWERGISYYRQGAVRNLEEDSPEEWVATVLGTEDYTVEVTLEDDKVMDYICDCPYEGDMCKHVVATLLTIRERKKTEKYFIQAEETESKNSGFSSETVKAEIDEILAIADKKQLMSFLSEYAVHHVDFRNALKQQFIPDRNTESLDTDYCQEVERCFSILTVRQWIWENRKICWSVLVHMFRFMPKRIQTDRIMNTWQKH